MSLTTVLIALFAGIIPSFVWLLFWLREDRLHPEPRSRILVAFIGGMFMVLVSLPIERYIQSSLGLSLTSIILLWALTEESLKYFAARTTSLRRKFVDEPVDVMIYMITTALGFAALENAFFILSPLSGGFVLESIVTGNLRFVGATLLHVSTSGVIGALLAYSFYKAKRIKARFFAAGLILSIFLHSIFNVLIITKAPDNPELFIGVFMLVWIVIIGLIFFFEKAKRIRPTRSGRIF